MSECLVHRPDLAPSRLPSPGRSVTPTPIWMGVCAARESPRWKILTPNRWPNGRICWLRSTLPDWPALLQRTQCSCPWSSERLALRVAWSPTYADHPTEHPSPVSHLKEHWTLLTKWNGCGSLHCMLHWPMFSRLRPSQCSAEPVALHQTTHRCGCHGEPPSAFPVGQPTNPHWWLT